MKPGWNCVVDAFWGSSGKGKLAAFLASTHRVHAASSANFPNAGHTVRIGEHKFVNKVLPSAVHGSTEWHPICFISPNSGFFVEQLVRECEEAGWPEVRIHERAVVMSDAHRSREANDLGLQALSSTMQGSAAAMFDKVMRRPGVLVRDLMTTLHRPASIRMLKPDDFSATVRQMLLSGKTWLHEVSQGYALSLDWGTHYPHCTSRNCSAGQAAADMGLSPRMASTGDTYLNVRSFPIRVGNYQDGYSGDFMPDCEETTIDQILNEAGAPPEAHEEYRQIETTTVTKRRRRMSTMSWSWLKEAAEANGATKLVLNFAQYIDWHAYKCREPRNLPPAVMAFVDKMQEATNRMVWAVGTGPDHEDMVVLR